MSLMNSVYPPVNPPQATMTPSSLPVRLSVVSMACDLPLTGAEAFSAIRCAPGYQYTNSFFSPNKLSCCFEIRITISSYNGNTLFSQASSSQRAFNSSSFSGYCSARLLDSEKSSTLVIDKDLVFGGDKAIEYEIRELPYKEPTGLEKWPPGEPVDLGKVGIAGIRIKPVRSTGYIVGIIDDKCAVDH